MISDIYDAAVDPRIWPQALGRACGFVGGAQAVMFWQDAAQSEADALFSYNDDPHFARLYHETYASLNPLFPAAIFEPVGSFNAGSDLVPDAEMHETRFYREWMAPQGLTDALAALLERDATRAAFLSFQWKGGAIDNEARHRMGLLVPHFQRAVAIGRLFVCHRATETALTATLDGIEAGVLLVGEDGRIVFANARGRLILDEGELLHDKSGRLEAVAPEANRALQASLRAAEAGDAAIGTQSAAISLTWVSDKNWMASILPLVDGARQRAKTTGEAVAAIFVRSSAPAEASPLEALATRYGLTASEIKVVEAMLRVSGLDAMAEALGISRATVKTHLNRVFRKSKTRNQAELIKLIAGLG